MVILAAVEEGFGGCILGAIDRSAIAKMLNLGDHLDFLWVIALGAPNEEIHLTEVGPDGDIKYYRDEKTVHYVPKRSLKEIVAVEFN